MKPRPRRDYGLSIHRETDELTVAHPDDPGFVALFQDLVRVTLNGTVSVWFMPAVPWPAESWSVDHLAPESKKTAEPEQARLETVMNAKYVVAPDAALAGTRQRFTFNSHADSSPPPGTTRTNDGGTVFYVEPDAFARYLQELDDLRVQHGHRHPRGNVQNLMDHEVVAFLENTVLTPDTLSPLHAKYLGRGAPKS